MHAEVPRAEITADEVQHRQLPEAACSCTAATDVTVAQGDEHAKCTADNSPLEGASRKTPQEPSPFRGKANPCAKSATPSQQAHCNTYKQMDTPRLPLYIRASAPRVPQTFRQRTGKVLYHMVVVVTDTTSGSARSNKKFAPMHMCLQETEVSMHVWQAYHLLV